MYKHPKWILLKVCWPIIIWLLTTLFYASSFAIISQVISIDVGEINYNGKIKVSYFILSNGISAFRLIILLRFVLDGINKRPIPFLAFQNIKLLPKVRAVKQLMKAVHNKLRDDKYLIGRRLNNFDGQVKTKYKQ